MKDVILVKFGGSIITDKNVPYKPRLDVIRGLAKELKKVTKASIVLAHGSGSFGHTSAEKFGGKRGYKSKWGIAKVARDAMEINRIVMDILIEEGLPAVSLRPMSMMITDAGKLKNNLFEIIEETLKQELMPVVYGDVLFDKKWKTTIYSGETTLNEIGIYLMRKGFKVGKIIQVGETNGVYDDKGKTIPSINKRNWKTIEHYILNSKRADVTGGMKHKIENALGIADKGIETWITSGIIPREFNHALRGKNIHGTIIQ
jgi:isopentenyl phosphate kinase